MSCLSCLVNVCCLIFPYLWYIGISAGIDTVEKAMLPQYLIENNNMFSCAGQCKDQITGKVCGNSKLQYRKLMMK